MTFPLIQDSLPHAAHMPMTRGLVVPPQSPLGKEPAPRCFERGYQYLFFLPPRVGGKSSYSRRPRWVRGIHKPISVILRCLFSKNSPGRENHLALMFFSIRRAMKCIHCPCFSSLYGVRRRETILSGHTFGMAPAALLPHGSPSFFRRRGQKLFRPFSFLRKRIRPSCTRAPNPKDRRFLCN